MTIGQVLLLLLPGLFFGGFAGFAFSTPKAFILGTICGILVTWFFASVSWWGPYFARFTQIVLW